MGLTDDVLPPGGDPIGLDPPWDAWHPREVAVGSPMWMRLGHADFEETLPLVSGDQRTWLAATLAQVHPGHIWLDRL